MLIFCNEMILQKNKKWMDKDGHTSSDIKVIFKIVTWCTGVEACGTHVQPYVKVGTWWRLGVFSPQPDRERRLQAHCPCTALHQSVNMEQAECVLPKAWREETVGSLPMYSPMLEWVHETGWVCSHHTLIERGYCRLTAHVQPYGGYMVNARCVLLTAW